MLFQQPEPIAPHIATIKGLEERLAAVTASAAEKEAELSGLRERQAEAVAAMEKRFQLALQAAATAVQTAERKCNAAQQGKERAEKNAAKAMVAEETFSVTADVKVQRLTAEIRALKQLNEKQQQRIQTMQSSSSSRSSSVTSAAAAAASAADAGLVQPTAKPRQAWSPASEPQPQQPGSQQEPEHTAAPAAAPAAAAAAPAGQPRGWELQLAWSSLEERRSILEGLLQSGPKISPIKSTAARSRSKGAGATAGKASTRAN